MDYMTPLGLHHLMGRGHHYGPGPWVEGGPRADWTSVYYHRADARASASIVQRRAAMPWLNMRRRLRAILGSEAVSGKVPALVPSRALGLPDTVRADSMGRAGRPLHARCASRRRHAQDVDDMARYVDPERHTQVAAFLAIQQQEAQWWRDASIAYFQTFSGRALPQAMRLPRTRLSTTSRWSFLTLPAIERTAGCEEETSRTNNEHRCNSQVRAEGRHGIAR